MPQDLPILTRRHMAALGEASRAMFMDRLAAHVTNIFPDRAPLLDSPEGAAALQKHIALGKKYGLSTERALTLFVDLIFGLGEGFDEKLEYRWIKNVLSDPDQSDTGKMYIIYRDLRANGASDGSVS